MKQPAADEAFVPVARDDFIREPEPVGAGDSAVLFVPEEKMAVVLVLRREIERSERAAADRAEACFPAPADLLHDVGELVESRDVNLEVAMADEAGFRRERLDIGL